MLGLRLQCMDLGTQHWSIAESSYAHLLPSSTVTSRAGPVALTCRHSPPHLVFFCAFCFSVLLSRWPRACSSLCSWNDHELHLSLPESPTPYTGTLGYIRGGGGGQWLGREVRISYPGATWPSSNSHTHSFCLEHTWVCFPKLWECFRVVF